MRIPTEQEILQQAKEYFENYYLECFTSKPAEYEITIEDDCIMIDGKWNNGTTDRCGFGNMYKWAWEQAIEKTKS